ncbi:MAG: LemA family protein [Candidatus Shapirobacteria bacterium]
MFIFLGLLVLVVLYIVGFYNGLKTTEVRIGASIQEIGNQLKRQAELIPNLVDSVKGYLTHEKGIFTQLTDARKLVTTALETQDPKAIDKAQASLTQALRSITVIAESNPEIKASNLVSNLMGELRDTSDKVMYARRTLIDLTADFNVKISTIPGIWFASMFGFKAKPGLETPTSGDFLTVNPKDTAPPQVKL